MEWRSLRLGRDTDANRRKWSEITQMRSTRDAEKKERRKQAKSSQVQQKKLTSSLMLYQINSPIYNLSIYISVAHARKSAYY